MRFKIQYFKDMMWFDVEVPGITYSREDGLAVLEQYRQKYLETITIFRLVWTKP